MEQLIDAFFNFLDVFSAWATIIAGAIAIFILIPRLLP